MRQYDSHPDCRATPCSGPVARRCSKPARQQVYGLSAWPCSPLRNALQWGSAGDARLAQALALEFDAVCVVDDPVQDGVGQGRVADDLVPVVDRHLAGDDQRAGAVAILDDLQQIALSFG
jgi:hypothetical protein